MHRYLFFSRVGADAPAPAAFAGGLYEAELWRPSRGAVRPAGLPWWPFGIWWLFHVARIFSNRDYAVFCVRTRGALVHRSCVFPRYFRFPFMAPGDLQIGDTWTHPEYRGRSLAADALRQIVHCLGAPDRRFWYLVEEDNVASIRAVEKAGFALNGTGRRTTRWGLALLGDFRKDEPKA